MAGLQIYARRERAMVSAADAVLRPLAWTRPLRKAATSPIRRILLLRLERIGDLLMTLDAIALARRSWPNATIDLAVGSWNVPLAKLIPGIDTIIPIDVPWLARERKGETWTALWSRARGWKRQRYDLAINFEPDIRSNVLAWLSGAPSRYGYWTGGGGALLTSPVAFEPAEHVGTNAERLVAAAVARSADGVKTSTAGSASRRLNLPDTARSRAQALLGGMARPLIGLHISGGRESKQWHLDRFVEVARRLAHERGASFVLTGSESDRPMVKTVADGLAGVRLLNVAGTLDLVELGAVLAALDLFITSDTGPMHLAAAVGTPVVALFGPADPRRYGPRAATERILRVDLPCSPCGQVRLPPERCRGHVPDCMDGITVAAVVRAASELLGLAARPAGTSARPG
jgi:lipopolysaccharide heptosyltransferase II